MNGNKRRDRRDGKIIGFFKDVFRRDCHWNVGSFIGMAIAWLLGIL